MKLLIAVTFAFLCSSVIAEKRWNPPSLLYNHINWNPPPTREEQNEVGKSWYPLQYWYQQIWYKAPQAIANVPIGGKCKDNSQCAQPKDGAALCFSNVCTLVTFDAVTTTKPKINPSKKCHQKSDCKYLGMLKINHRDYDCVHGKCSFLPRELRPHAVEKLLACTKDDDCPGGYVCIRRECEPILSKSFIENNKKPKKCHRKSDCSYLSMLYINHRDYDCIHGKCSFLSLEEHLQKVEELRACITDWDCPIGYVCQRQECVQILPQPVESNKKPKKCHRKSDCLYLSMMRINHKDYDCIHGKCSFLEKHP